MICSTNRQTLRSKLSTKSSIAALFVCVLFTDCAPNSSAQQVSPNTQTAFGLFNQHKYAAAADIFERIIQKSPSARLCYYAALANRSCYREARAQQLFAYINSRYPASNEAALAKTALSPKQTAIASASTGESDELPETIIKALPPEAQELLKTEEGRRKVMKALKGQEKQIEAIRLAQSQHLSPQIAVSGAGALTAAGTIPIKKPALNANSDHPFTAADIARDGAEGIDQSRYPNCWFEASMSALAQLPRGQRLLASMIQSKSKDEYIVRFPNDGVEYIISTTDLANEGIHNHALWASIIEAAQLEKFPENSGAQGREGDQSRLEVGLGCITGCKAEVVYPSNCSEEELSSFIGAAVKSGNPVVAGTFGDAQLAVLPTIIVPQHAYTIIGLDQSKSMILLRNPHGHGARAFQLSDDPQHLEFEQLENGKFKMSIPKFQKYFYSICRSFI